MTKFAVVSHPFFFWVLVSPFRALLLDDLFLVLALANTNLCFLLNPLIPSTPPLSSVSVLVVSVLAFVSSGYHKKGNNSKNQAKIKRKHPH